MQNVNVSLILEFFHTKHVVGSIKSELIWILLLDLHLFAVIGRL